MWTNVKSTNDAERFGLERFYVVSSIYDLPVPQQTRPGTTLQGIKLQHSVSSYTNDLNGAE